MYIWFLITSRDDPKAKGVGRALVARCEQEAINKGVELLRLDCFDGDDAKGALVKVYEGMGFAKMGRRIDYGEGWLGQVLGKRVKAKGGEEEAKGGR